MAQPPPTPLLPSRIGEVSLLLGTEPIFDLGDDSWLAEEPDTPKASGSSLPPRQVSPVFQGARSAIQVTDAGAVGEEFAFVAETTFEGPILQGRGENAQDEARRLDSPTVEMRRSLSRSTSSLSSSKSGLHQRRPDRDDFFARRLSSSTSRPSSPFLHETLYRAAGSPPSFPAPLYSPSVAHTSFGSEDLEVTEVKMAWKERSLPVDRPILARVGPPRTVMTEKPFVKSGIDEPKLRFNGTQRLTISKVSQIPRHTSALSQFLAGSSFASRPQPLAGPSTFQSPLPPLDPLPLGIQHNSALGLSFGSSSFSPPPVEMARSAEPVPNAVHEMDQQLPLDDLADEMNSNGDPFNQDSPFEPGPPITSDEASTDRIALRSEEMEISTQVGVDDSIQHTEDDHDVGDRSMPGAFDFQLPTLAEISDSDNSMSLADGSMSKSERRSSRLLSFFTGFLKGSGEAERLSRSVTKSVAQDQIDVHAPEPTHDEMIDTISNTTAGIRANARNGTKRSREEEAILPQDTASHIAERLSGSAKPARQTTTRSPPRKKAAGYIPLTRPVAPFRVALQPSKTMLSASSNAQPAKEAKSSSDKIKPTSRGATQSAFASAALARLPPPGKGCSSSAKPIVVKDTERVKDLAARRKAFEGTTRPEQPTKKEGERGSSKGSISRPVPVHGSVVRTVPVSGMTPGKASRERALARRQFDDAVRTNLELKEQERRREERLRLKKEEEEYLRSRKETVIRANPVPQMYRTAREA